MHMLEIMGRRASGKSRMAASFAKELNKNTHVCTPKCLSDTNDVFNTAEAGDTIIFEDVPGDVAWALRQVRDNVRKNCTVILVHRA